MAVRERGGRGAVAPARLAFTRAASGPNEGEAGREFGWAKLGVCFIFLFFFYFFSFPRLFQKGILISFLKIKPNTQYKIKYSSMYAQACL